MERTFPYSDVCIDVERTFPYSDVCIYFSEIKTQKEENNVNNFLT